MRCSLVLTVGCVLAVGCSQPGDSGLAARPHDSLDVYEAVFRYRLNKEPAGFKAYLSVEGKDPPAELLERLHKDWPNLKPASAEPKEKGHRVYAEDIKWEGRDAAVLHAGYWFPTRFAGEGYSADHRVIHGSGRWTVVKVTNEISS